jgi:polyisoprenyl-phosphate glycosyltransferase
MGIENIHCSIIIPVYFNESTLWITFLKLKELVFEKNPDKRFEIIFIDDGSLDSSINKLLEIKNEYPNDVKIIKFTRNFGQVPAIKAGYNIAKGECIINISADMQDPPELINDMLNQYFNVENSYEVVICARSGRDESWYRRKTSRIFYKTINRLSFRDMPEGGFDFVLVSRKVLDIINKNYEANPFWQGQILWSGFKTKFIYYQRLKRLSGTTKWTFSKKIKYLIDGLMGYSYFPVRLMTVLGSLISLIGFVYAAIIIVMRIAGKVPFIGWAPIMVIILILSGIQMLMLGIIGEYLWRTLDQVRNRPQYIIEKIY